MKLRPDLYAALKKTIEVAMLLLLFSGRLLAQCTGTQTFTANPTPLPGNTYNPGQVVTFCYTMAGFNEVGANWIDGFDLTIGPGWVAGSLSPTTPPTNCGGGGGQWMWDNSVTGQYSGATWGPGYFFDLNIDGNAGNDYGDQNTANCTWSFCFTLTAGNTPGASLAVGVQALSDGQAGSWGSTACSGTPTTLSTATVSPPPGTVFVTAGSTICAGQSVTLTATGATTYTWSPATGLSATTGTTVTATPASTTTYTVTGSGGCSSCTATTTITVNPVPTVSIAPAAPQPICAGQSIALTASGASTYAWSPGLWLSPTTGATVTSTPASNINYTVTGTTAGCSGTATVHLDVAPIPVITINPSSASICSGESTTLTASGATTYAWSPATGLSSTTGASVTANPLTTTTYTVTGTTASCTATRTVVVTVKSNPAVTVSPVNTTLCTAGSVTLIATGAAGTYAWSPATGLSATTGASVTASPLATTTYTVTGTAINGCTDTANATITIAPDLTITVNPAAPSICNGSGTTLTAGGALNYSWSPATGLSATSGASVTANPVTTTTYTVTGTDANGCTGTATVTVTVNPLPVVNVNPDIPSICNGNSILLTGTGASTYAWSPGTGLSATTGTTVTAGPSTSGFYTLTGTDANGCVGTDDFIVIVTIEVTENITTTDPLCAAGSDGTATAVPLTGSPPFTYLWSNGQTGITATGLAAGNVDITVTDAVGCIGTASATLADPPAITSAIIPFTYPGGSNVSCAGAADGSADLIVTGGTGDYTFLWSNGQTTEDASNLAAGNYTVTITDEHNCTATDNITITAPVAMSIILNSPATYGGYNVTCAGHNDGVITAAVSNGAAPYTYLWSNGATTQNISNGNAGNQSVTVTDANGCSAIANIVLTQPPGMTSSVTASAYAGGYNVSCNGAADGAADLTVTNAAAGTLTYAWSNSATTEDIGNLTAGNYSVLVTDVNGCTTTSSLQLTQPPALSGTLFPLVYSGNVSVSCAGASDGIINATASGGTAPYTYSWSNGQTTQNANNLAAGNYTLTITDANSCTQSYSAMLNQPAVLTTSILNSSLNVSGFDISCYGEADGTADLTVSGGVAPYTYSWSNGTLTQDLNNVPAGSYNVTITDDNGCTATDAVTLTEPPEMFASIISFTDVTCYGGNDGSATANVTGGVFPYTYQWETGQTMAAVTNFTAGIHDVIITDASGCIAHESITISQPLVLSSAVTGSAAICPGQTAQLTATPAGGTAPYTYSWVASPSDPTLAATDQNPVVSPVTSTTYTLTISDANGCVLIADPVSVPVNPALSIVLDPPGPIEICPGDSITINCTAAGGDGAYSCTVNGSPINYSSAYSATPYMTAYQVFSVTDNCGSTPVSDSVLVTVNPLPVISFNADPLSGCEPLEVHFTDNTVPTPVTYLWNFGDPYSAAIIPGSSSPTHTYNNAGIYSVSLTAVTADGCTDSLTVNNMIEVFPLPGADFTFSPQTINILEAMIDFNDQSSGAASWLWDFGDDSTSTLVNPQHLYSDTGTFRIWLTVTSPHGCKDSTQSEVKVTPDFMIYIPNAFTPDANGLNDGFRVYGQGIKKEDFALRVFNRWGEEVFSTFDPDGMWQGDFNGNGQPIEPGVYVYTVLLKDIHNRIKSYKGHVTVLR